MFHLYTGNRLEDLAEILARILSLSVPKNPFEQEQILVQSPGMAQWLKIHLAGIQGITAGYEFPLPSTFVWRCFQQTLDDIPNDSEFNKAFLVWRIMRLLDKHLPEPEFQQLAWYLEEDDTLLRRFQLCNMIADIYDQYLMYRPDWIAAWESGDNIPKHLLSSKQQTVFAEQIWQPILWQDIVADTVAHDQSLYHRANLTEALLDITRAHLQPEEMPKRIFIFGVSSLPPNTLQALRVLAEADWVEIHLFLQNPCRYYWGDIVDKHYLGRQLKRQNLKPNQNPDTLHLDANPLLASWGRLGRDYIDELQSFAEEGVTAFVDYHDFDAHSTSPNNSTLPLLLHYIQQDILLMENHGALEERTLSAQDSTYKHQLALDDQSVAFQVCHSALREVEVLHDYLLSLFAADDELTPKDVIVMLPDVNQYSPFVQAVFGQAPESQRIPYSLIDQTAQMENVVIDAYVNLLSLTESRFTFSDVISILEVPAVLKTFGIQVQELDQVRQWCYEAGVRWGLNSETAGVFALPQQQHNTWQNGLNRMLLGYAIGHDSIWQDLLSYGEVEGLKADLAGKLAAFLNAIRITEQALKQPQTPADWCQTLYQISSRFFTLPENDAFPDLLAKQISGLIDEWQHTHFTDVIDIRVIKAVLVPYLQETQGSKRFLAGRVNFCTLMPMRSVPFKVVCLLGMNEGAYPRSLVPTGFDLMAGEYRSGDRSRREDDKYLFLEALMSARENLYISYVGRTVKENSELNPSILVSELIDYVGQSCTLARDKQLAPEASQKALLSHLITEHKLQPFHVNYYSQTSDKKYISYNSSWLPTVLQKQVKGQTVKPAQQEESDQAENSQEQNDPKKNHLKTNHLKTKDILIDLQPEEQVVELEQMVRFYQHPARYFMQHRLKAFLQQQETEEIENEPFILDGLTRYQLKENLLAAIQKDQLPLMIKQLKLSGKYPYGVFGDMEVEELIHQATIMAKALAAYPKSRPTSVNIDLDILSTDPVSTGDETVIGIQQTLDKQTAQANVRDHENSTENQKEYRDRLVAWLPTVTNNLALHHHLGQLGANKKVAVWLAHLALSAQGAQVESHIVSFKNSRSTDIVTHKFTQISPEQAKALLSNYAQLFRYGNRDVLPLPAKTADIWTQAYLDDKYEDEDEKDKQVRAWNKALTSYQDTFNEFAEGRNVYWQRFLPDFSAAQVPFTYYCLQVWVPLQEHLQVVTDEEFEVYLTQGANA
ncbi:exodeoxyribonuclease V subunit gamma [Marinomonas agarivorans]|nr:exodeoxyribonuclease V subunit gamma [Marinomonas agarivorans]